LNDRFYSVLPTAGKSKCTEDELKDPFSKCK
jgi:hypothetical protein